MKTKKKISVILLMIVAFLCFLSCNKNMNTSYEKEDDKKIPQNSLVEENASEAVLKEGSLFTVSGTVDFSDEPGDIGEEYCIIKGDIEFHYYYDDIYGEESEWSSDTFYTKGKDTEFLKEYVGQELTLTGSFSSEVHGVPYITDVSIVSEEEKAE